MEMNLSNPDYQQKLMEPGGIAELADQMENEAPAIDEELNETIEEEIEADAEIAVDSVDEEEETQELAEDSEELEEDTEEEEEQIDPEKEKSMKHLRQQVKYEQEQRQRLEAELTQIRQFLEQAAQQQNTESEEEDYEPIDPKQAEEVAKLKKQQQDFQTQVMFQSALNAAEADATQKYPDFSDAYGHLMQQKTNEIASLHGITPEQAQPHAFKFMQATAFNAF